VESVAPLIHSRRHDLALTLPPQPVFLFADPMRLEQVFSNLLNNAAKYTPEGGHIWLTASLEGGGEVVGWCGSEAASPEVPHHLTTPPPHHPAEVAVTVRDDGVGIPEDMLERIFDLFAQVERSLSSASQWGLGIGLALVRTLVDMHGGSVKASSAGPDKGSEFDVRLPLLAEPRESTRSPEAAPPVRAARRARVLVVDDSRDAAQSLALLLRIKGHDVRTAHDGPEALDVARQQQPDVIFLDIGLPYLNGFE